jgi:hypothetical protein
VIDHPCIFCVAISRRERAHLPRGVRGIGSGQDHSDWADIVE